MLIFFVAILLANLFTLAIAIAAAVKRPILRHKLIAGLALCATLFALRQLVTSQGNPFALMFTVLLIVGISWPRRN